MQFHVAYLMTDLGYLEIRPDGYSAENVRDPSHRQRLQGILDEAFAKGLKTRPVHGGKEEILRPDDPRFALMLGQMLETKGYVIR